MTPLTPIHQLVFARFRELFGEPDKSLGRDNHWSIKPHHHRPSINILFDGGSEWPTVWIFDPNGKHDGMLRTAIRDERDLEAVVNEIQTRVKSISDGNDKGGVFDQHQPKS